MTTVRTALVALFNTYNQASAAVRDLEIAGIAGEEVEVVSDVDRDARAAVYGMDSLDGIRERIAHTLRGLSRPTREVHDESGEMPDYIGEQEFYATHVKEEGAIVVVRVPSEVLAGVAEAILKEHGSRTRDGKNGVLVVRQDDHPRSNTAIGSV